MNIKSRYTLLSFSLLFLFLLSCGKDDDKPMPICDTFSSADSVCFCVTHGDDLRCATFTLSLFTEEKASLTPHQTNGTLWSKGFVIDHSIYIIDRESGSPHSFFKLDIQKNEGWETKANFPGIKYGLTGSANGKGYASSYASKKFWEYDPEKNEWLPLTDLPFSTAETHWIEYKEKFYVPNNSGIFEFNATTKEWTKISTQVSSGFGAIFLVGDDMYWYDINDSYMSRYNFIDKSYEKVNVPDDFNRSTLFNAPFVINNTAMVVSSNDLWTFDAASKTWSFKKDAIKSGSAYGDDVFVVDGKPYLIDNGYVKVFEIQ